MRKLEIKNVDCHATLAMTKNTQSGRSMIEMLGVLAIIGVLSVGGIAGYSKAMQKYRINKTIEQITLIAGNIRTFFAPQRSYSGISGTVLKKAKLVPDEMWNGSNIINAWGGQVNIDLASSVDGKGDNKAFSIMFLGLPQEACIELLSQDYTALDVKMIDIIYSNDVAFTNFTPISFEQVVNECDGDNATVRFYFDIKEAYAVYTL